VVGCVQLSRVETGRSPSRQLGPKQICYFFLFEAATFVQKRINWLYFYHNLVAGL